MLHKDALKELQTKIDNLFKIKQLKPIDIAKTLDQFLQTNFLNTDEDSIEIKNAIKEIADCYRQFGSNQITKNQYSDLLIEHSSLMAICEKLKVRELSESFIVLMGKFDPEQLQALKQKKLKSASPIYELSALIGELAQKNDLNISDFKEAFSNFHNDELKNYIENMIAAYQKFFELHKKSEVKLQEYKDAYDNLVKTNDELYQAVLFDTTILADQKSHSKLKETLNNLLSKVSPASKKDELSQKDIKMIEKLMQTEEPYIKMQTEELYIKLAKEFHNLIINNLDTWQKQTKTTLKIFGGESIRHSGKKYNLPDGVAQAYKAFEKANLINADKMNFQQAKKILEELGKIGMKKMKGHETEDQKSATRRSDVTKDLYNALVRLNENYGSKSNHFKLIDIKKDEYADTRQSFINRVKENLGIQDNLQKKREI
ncbi:MAG: hypothetical protein ACD_46C00550G0001 [uncultured bacterium]|nr:MAG: hypothetical protein ACD_46C00550G0001 [uncultured bacterium]